MLSHNHSARTTPRVEGYHCSLSSTNMAHEHTLHCPPTPPARWDELLVVLAVTLLRSNRVVQANAACEACGSAIDQISKMRAAVASGSLTAQAGVEMQLKLDALCTLVMTCRAYSKDEVMRRAEKQASDAYVARLRAEAANRYVGVEAATVDPRFMAFEFLWSLQLRARQVRFSRLTLQATSDEC